MGTIYLLECYNGFEQSYKIGFTRGSVEDRIRSLQVGNNRKITVITTFKTKYNQKLESTLHKYFKNKWEKGEWFALSEEDITGFVETCTRLELNFDSLKDNPYMKY